MDVAPDAPAPDDDGDWFPLLMDVLPHGVLDLDLRAGTFWGSPRLHAMNKAPDGTLNGPLDEIRKSMHPDDLARHTAALRTAIEARQRLYRNVVRIRGHDGVYRVRELRYLILYEGDEAVRLIGVSTDVREIGAVAGDLEARSASLETKGERGEPVFPTDPVGPEASRRGQRAAVDADHSAVLVFDAADRLINANDAARRFCSDDAGDATPMLGWTRADVDAHLVRLGRFPADPPPADWTCDVARELELPDGRHLAVRRSPLAEGGSVTIISDVSEMRHMRRQLEAAERLASLGELVAGITHEINAPLGVAVTAASYLETVVSRLPRERDAGRLSEQSLHRVVEGIVEGSRLTVANLGRAAALVRSLKQVAYDQLSDDRRRLNVGRYLADVVASLLPEIRRRGHELDLEATDVGEIVTQPGAVSQIVTNLVINSLRHGYPDGRPGRLRLVVRSVPGGVVIDYADDGVGVEPALLSRIFEPFFTTRREQGGTGLGLSIVRNLVVGRLGGEIHSGPGPAGGLAHTITLPSDPGTRLPPASTDP